MIGDVDQRVRKTTKQECVRRQALLLKAAVKEKVTFCHWEHTGIIFEMRFKAMMGDIPIVCRQLALDSYIPSMLK
jgi:hypothetical protein